jgi:putative redox protein
MKITLKSTGQPAQFEAKNERGHTVVVEGRREFGGRDAAPSPTELLLMSQAGCTAIDVVTLLRKMRQSIANLEISSEGFRTPGQIPNVLDRIHLHFRIFGEVDPDKAEKAITMSIEKYCPISKMIDQVTQITHSFEIMDK